MWTFAYMWHMLSFNLSDYKYYFSYQKITFRFGNNFLINFLLFRKFL